MLSFFKGLDRLQRSALGILIFIVVLGIIILSLMVLDIDEDFRFNLPVNVFNTVFIAALALPIIYVATKSFIRRGAPALLALGGALLAFSIGSLLKGWLPNTSLDVLISIYESTVIVTSLILLIGAIWAITRPPDIELKPGQHTKAVFLSYAGVVVIILVIVWLAFKEIIPSSVTMSGDTVSAQDIMQAVSTLLLFASAIIYIRMYVKSPTELSYWYFTGLLFFAFGVLFISQGPVESRIAWLGRISQYVGNLCFLAAVAKEHQRTKFEAG